MWTMRVFRPISASRRASYALWVGLLGVGCARGEPRPATPDRASKAEAKAGPSCEKELSLATAQWRDGNLWGAQRTLEACPRSVEVAALSARISLELGDVVAGKRWVEMTPTIPPELAEMLDGAQQRERQRKPAPVRSVLQDELAPAGHALQAGECVKAEALAIESAERWNPNPDALLLASRALQCQGKPNDARRVRARAAGELERSKAGLNWAIPNPKSGSVDFLDDGHLQFALDDQRAQLTLAGLGTVPSAWTRGARNSEGWVWDGRIRIVQSDEGLTARDVISGAVLWSLPRPASTAYQRAFSKEELLTLEPTEFHTLRWSLVSLSSGQVLRSGSLRAHYCDPVVVSPNGDWFTCISPDEFQRDYQFHIVSSKTVRTFDTRRLAACQPKGAWSASEVLMQCLDELKLMDIKSLALRPLVHLTRTFGVTSAVESSTGIWALWGDKGVALLQREGNGAKLAMPSELLSQVSGRVTWSPNGRYFAFTSELAGGRSGFELWALESSLESARRVMRLRGPELRRNSGVAAIEGDNRIGLTQCSTLSTLDLSTGEYVMSPLPVESCDSVVDDVRSAATAGPSLVVTPRAAPGKNEQVFLWTPGGAPARLPNWSTGSDETLSAGPWLAMRAGVVLTLPLQSRVLELPEDTHVLAFSRDGELAILKHYEPPRAHLRLVRLHADTVTFEELWREDDTKTRSAVFSADGQRVALTFEQDMRILGKGSATHWELRESSSGTEPEMVEWGLHDAWLSSDTLFFPNDRSPGRTQAARPLVPAHSAPLDKDPKRRRLQFAFGDSLVVGPTTRGVAIWSTLNGDLEAELLSLPYGGWLVTEPPTVQSEGKPSSVSKVARGAGPEQTLVQLLGTDESGLWCRSGDEYYPWELCQDRFEDAEVLKRLTSKFKATRTKLEKR